MFRNKIIIIIIFFFSYMKWNLIEIILLLYKYLISI